MGIFSFFSKKNKDQDIEEYQNLTLDEAFNISVSGKKKPKGVKAQNEVKSNKAVTDVLTAAKDYCGQMYEMQRRLEESGKEYDIVTLYLKDIHEIDKFSLDKRAAMEDAARQILNLNKERDKHQKKEHDISKDLKFRHLAQYEDILPNEIVKIESQEKYQLLIRSDLQQLEGERGVILYEKESSVDKRKFIKKFSIGVIVLVASIFMLLFILNDNIEADLSVPFFLVGLMALIAIAYIVLETRNAVFQYKSAEIKQNKLIGLVNKVKIKYVNCTSTLEYLYEKYRVNSSAELNYLWTQYVKFKDEAARYQHNTELLMFYSNELVELLRAEGLKDPDVWVYQTEALLDSKEMVEVRHRLNKRRQKLRERMDYNMKQLKLCKAEIMGLRKRFPEYEEQISTMLLPENDLQNT